MKRRNFINENYVAVPIDPISQETHRCRALTPFGQCTNSADWQIKKRQHWAPICYIHMHELVDGFRKSETTEVAIAVIALWPQEKP